MFRQTAALFKQSPSSSNSYNSFHHFLTGVTYCPNTYLHLIKSLPLLSKNNWLIADSNFPYASSNTVIYQNLKKDISEVRELKLEFTKNKLDINEKNHLIEYFTNHLGKNIHSLETQKEIEITWRKILHDKLSLARLDFFEALDQNRLAFVGTDSHTHNPGKEILRHIGLVSSSFARPTITLTSVTNTYLIQKHILDNQKLLSSNRTTFTFIGNDESDEALRYNQKAFPLGVEGADTFSEKITQREPEARKLSYSLAQ